MVEKPKGRLPPGLTKQQIAELRKRAEEIKEQRIQAAVEAGEAVCIQVIVVEGEDEEAAKARALAQHGPLNGQAAYFIVRKIITGVPRTWMEWLTPEIRDAMRGVGNSTATAPDESATAAVRSNAKPASDLTPSVAFSAPKPPPAPRHVHDFALACDYRYRRIGDAFELVDRDGNPLRDASAKIRPGATEEETARESMAARMPGWDFAADRERKPSTGFGDHRLHYSDSGIV